MLFDSARDGAYGTAAANDRASPLRWIPCVAALMERADRRFTRVHFVVKLSAGGGADAVPDAVPQDPVLYGCCVHDSVVLYRRVNLPRSLSA
jgi:hypothetical protein